MPSAIVIGSGISGLTAALRLQQAGVGVTVLERDDHIGGRMVSTRRDGFTINRAAGIIPSSYTQLRALIDELGLADQTRLIATELAVPVGSARHRLRTSGAGMLVDALRTGLLSPQSKLLMGRLVRDAVRARAALSYDPGTPGVAALDVETAADYCHRRLNDQILERVVDPVARGMFLVGPEHVSVADLFFMVLRILGRRQVEYLGGIDLIVRAIADRVQVVTGAHVTAVDREGDEVVVSCDGEDHRVDGCVVAVTGREVARIHRGLTPEQHDFLAAQTGWSNSIVGHFALTRRPPETALLTAIPSRESDTLGLVVFHDLVAPDCVPAGRGLVSGYWMHDWSTANAARSDAELRPLLLADLERFVPGIGGLVDFAVIDRWKPVVMRCGHGVYAKLAEFTGSLDPADRIQLAGDFFGYGSTNRCSLTGQLAAQRLAATVSSVSRSSNAAVMRPRLASEISSG